MKISRPLKLNLACFVASLLMDKFEDPQDLALALDELADLAWKEVSHAPETPLRLLP